MSSGLKLSPKHGLNPTIPVCFWCGKERGDIALLGRIGDVRKGEDIEAERHTVIDYEPCDKCLDKMDAGFAVIEATDSPNKITSIPIRGDIYPTGWQTIRPSVFWTMMTSKRFLLIARTTVD